MKKTSVPDPNTVHPIPNYENEIFVRPTITNPNIVVGDFTYIAETEFESHVTHLYEWNNDRLIIGRFCQIAAGVEFIMNGANHKMNCATTYPFFTFDGWDAETPPSDDMGLRGDTVIGNDVWIGQNATILPGVHIGDGAIIGADAVVGSDIPPYTVAVGNPARVMRHRFDNELTELLLRLRWWDRPIDEIKSLVPLLTSSDLENVKEKIKEKLAKDERRSLE